MAGVHSLSAAGALGALVALTAGCGSSGGRDGAAVDGAAPEAAGAEAGGGDGAGAASCGAGSGSGWTGPMADPGSSSYDTSVRGVVIDRVTGLWWQRAVDAQMLQWRQAGAACGCLDLAGHRDWRLPSRIELVSIVDFTRHDPAIDGGAFPDTPTDWFWSSSPVSGSDPPAAWYVAFFDGNTHQAELTVSYHLRCVRGG